MYQSNPLDYLPDVTTATMSQFTSENIYPSSTSCRYATGCHSYSHTVQYFPECALQQSTARSESYEHIADSANMILPSQPQIDNKEQTETLDTSIGDDMMLNEVTDRKKNTTNKRCWNTANYQWMNIKRERRASAGKEI